MQAIELLRAALAQTDEGLAAIAAPLHSHPLIQPVGRGSGNHPTWILGHLAFVEGAVCQAITGKSNPMAQLEPICGMGSEPKPEAALYPPFQELLSTCRRLRQETIRLLDEIGDGGLDRVPAHVPPGFEEVMPTIGRAFLLLTLHQMVHYGQLADARRAAGIAPLI